MKLSVYEKSCLRNVFFDMFFYEMSFYEMFQHRTYSMNYHHAFEKLLCSLELFNEFISSPLKVIKFRKSNKPSLILIFFLFECLKGDSSSAIHNFPVHWAKKVLRHFSRFQDSCSWSRQILCRSRRTFSRRY